MRLTRTPPPNVPGFLRIAVAAPLPMLFDYLPAAGGSGSGGAPKPGMRVLVPFGRSRRLGVIVELITHTEQNPQRLRPIESVLDESPLLQTEDIELILWAADYYQHAPGEALFSALPVRLRRPAPPL